MASGSYPTCRDMRWRSIQIVQLQQKDPNTSSTRRDTFKKSNYQLVDILTKSLKWPRFSLFDAYNLYVWGNISPFVIITLQKLIICKWWNTIWHVKNLLYVYHYYMWAYLDQTINWWVALKHGYAKMTSVCIVPDIRQYVSTEYSIYLFNTKNKEIPIRRRHGAIQLKKI
jgi:hypothetical protein